MSSRDHDVPLLHGTFSVRNPRSVALLQPYQLGLVAALMGISIVFTFWPQVLEHTPVSFEQRGIIHHIWHYMLLTGSMVTLVGMFSASRRRLAIELVGLSLLTGALGANFVAVIADPIGSDVSGLGVAFRIAAIFGLSVRAYIVATEPTVNLRSDGGL